MRPRVRCTGVRAPLTQTCILPPIPNFSFNAEPISCKFETRNGTPALHHYHHHPSALSAAGALGAFAQTAAPPAAAFQTVGLAARDLATLAKAATALGLPGSARLSGEIMRFVVAEDLFALCTPEMQVIDCPVIVAVLLSG